MATTSKCPTVVPSQQTNLSNTKTGPKVFALLVYSLLWIRVNVQIPTFYFVMYAEYAMPDPISLEMFSFCWAVERLCFVDTWRHFGDDKMPQQSKQCLLNCVCQTQLVHIFKHQDVLFPLRVFQNFKFGISKVINILRLYPTTGPGDQPY